MFTPELVANLNRSLKHLAAQIKEKISPSELQKQRIKTELNNLYIRQTDYTRDYLGYFLMMSLVQHKFDTLRQIGEIIGMEFSQSHS